MAPAAPRHVGGGGPAPLLWRRRGKMEEAALALERFCSPGKGSGLRARRPLRPGQLLCRAQPFAYVVCKAQLGTVCEQCLQRYVAAARTAQPPFPQAPPGQRLPFRRGGAGPGAGLGAQRGGGWRVLVAGCRRLRWAAAGSCAVRGSFRFLVRVFV